MEMWFTNLDIEICCLHEDGKYGYVQISSLDEDRNVVECKTCGQRYEVKLDIKPIEKEQE